MKHTARYSTILSILLAMALPGVALAQDPESDPEAAEMAPEPEPEPEPVYTPPPPPPAEEPMEEEEEEEGSIMDNVTWQAMASAYYQFDVERVPNAAGEPGHRAYARNHGFGLPFAGADFAYAGDDFGVTINLRFGEGAPLLIAGANNYPLLNNLKQGYVSWFAAEGLTIDLGWFDTIYGAEVADEWVNVNYSRGALYFLMQPFNHTGLRVQYEASDALTLRFLVVNDNFAFADVQDLNEVPAFGAQVALAPSDDIGLAIGYATQPENVNTDWSHFFDVVASIGMGSATLVLNADLRFNPALPGDITDNLYFGASAAVGIDVSDEIALGGRVEYLYGGSFDGAYSGLGAESLITVTPTFRYKPADGLILTLEPRLEWANEEIFLTRSGTSALSVTVLAGATAVIGN